MTPEGKHPWRCRFCEKPLPVPLYQGRIYCSQNCRKRQWKELRKKHRAEA